MKLEKVIAERIQKTIYRVDDTAVKVFDKEFSKADVLNEALNQSRVELTGLYIPKVIEVTNIDGKWAIVSEFIEGKTLDQLMSENPDKLDDYLNLFVDLQIQMHKITAPELNKLKDKLNRKLLAAKLDSTVRYELRTRLESMPKHVKLCHGDFNPSNIIIDKDGMPCILDWSHATIGNASSDVALTYLLLKLKYNDDTCEKYIDLFCKKTDTKKDYIKKWLPLVAAAQLSKCKTEKEIEFLNKWIDVVDYE